MALAKSYIYKVFRSGDFIGVLQNVTSPFKYNLNINAAAAALEITVGQDPYESQTSVDTLITESGDDIITESGDILATERAVPIFGNESPLSLLRNGNTVQVFEVSSNNPTGKKVFEGTMTRARANFGGSGQMGCTIISYGAELDNYIIQTGNTQQAQQALKTTTMNFGYWSHGMAQIITPTSSFSLSQIELWLRVSSPGSTIVTLDLCVGDPSLDSVVVIGGIGTYTFGGSNQLLATSAPVTVNDTTAASKLFSFATAQPLTSGLQYYIRAFFTQGDAGFLEATTAGVGDLPLGAAMIGQLYNAKATFNNSGFSMLYSTANPALYITLYSSGGSIVSPFSSLDPATILQQIITNYASQGGHINYATGTIVATGLTRSYSFNLNTTLEGVKKVLELGPSNYYWRVDPATSIIYYKPVSTTGDHKMVLGQHIQELDLEATIEKIINLVYFTGGGNPSLFIKSQSAASLAQYPQQLSRPADNRVTTSSTAQAIVDNLLGTSANEAYTTTLKIPETVYDISLFDPGETVSFGGFGNLVDRLVLQIVAVSREADLATLTLGVLPLRASQQMEDAQRELFDLQTINNPSTPS